MNLDRVLGIISLVLAVVGTALAIHYGREARRLTQRLRRFEWHDIESALKKLSQEIEKDFSPDLILSSSGGSVGIIANMYLTYTKRFIPLYVGVSKHHASQFSSPPIYHASFTTNRWNTYIPEELAQLKDHKVLILEDVVLSGETLTQMRNALLSWGYAPNRVRSAAVFMSQFAVSQGAEPDYYWLRLSDTHFELPWGSSIGKTPH